jgi:hypothetical protein
MGRVGGVGAGPAAMGVDARSRSQSPHLLPLVPQEQYFGVPSPTPSAPAASASVAAAQLVLPPPLPHDRASVANHGSLFDPMDDTPGGGSGGGGSGSGSGSGRGSSAGGRDADPSPGPASAPADGSPSTTVLPLDVFLGVRVGGMPVAAAPPPAPVAAAEPGAAAPAAVAAPARPSYAAMLRREAPSAPAPAPAPGGAAGASGEDTDGDVATARGQRRVSTGHTPSAPVLAGGPGSGAGSVGSWGFPAQAGSAGARPSRDAVSDAYTDADSDGSDSGSWRHAVDSSGAPSGAGSPFVGVVVPTGPVTPSRPGGAGARLVAARGGAVAATTTSQASPAPARSPDGWNDALLFGGEQEEDWMSPTAVGDDDPLGLGLAGAGVSTGRRLRLLPSGGAGGVGARGAVSAAKVDDDERDGDDRSNSGDGVSDWVDG